MKKHWELFWNSFWISFKHSNLRLLCLLCVLLLCTALLTVFFRSLPQNPAPEKAKVGIINLDGNAFSVSMMRMALGDAGLSDMIETTDLPPDEESRTEYTAIITIPRGFLESILNGENLSPIVELDWSSPLEAMWVRQMILAGTRALSAAQRGVYAVLEAANWGKDMDEKEYNILMAEVNMQLLNAFFDKLSLLKSQKLSASGSLTLPQYYACALAAFLPFCYGFLFQPAIKNLKRFSQAVQKKWILFFAGWSHVFLLEALSALPAFLLFAKGKFAVMPWLIFGFLAGTSAFLCALLFPEQGVCAAAHLALATGQALCGGLLLPLALLPAGFSAVAPFLPVWQGMQLMGTSMGETVSFGVPFVMGMIMIFVGIPLWKKKEG